MPREELSTLLAHHAAKNAFLRFSINRDETDSYNLELEHYAAGINGPTSHLQSADLMNLLPTGTSFRKLVGWRSIFGSQFLCGGVSVAVIGIEQIVAHPTRGAFPCSHIYIYPNLMIAADGLSLLMGELPAPARDAYLRNMIYPCTSEAPIAHLVHEASTIACAIHSWKANRQFLFRTLLVDESTLRLPGHPGPPFKRVSIRGGEFKYQGWLICTVRTVRDGLSLLTRTWMHFNESSDLNY